MQTGGVQFGDAQSVVHGGACANDVLQVHYAPVQNLSQFELFTAS